MDKNKVPIIILAILFIASLFVAFSFYNQANQLKKDNESLLAANTELDSSVQKYKADFKDALSQRDRAVADSRGMKQTLDAMQAESDKWKQRYERINRDKETLLDKIKELTKSPRTAQAPSTQSTAASSMSGYASAATSSSDAHWQDLIERKAELEVQLEELNGETGKFTLQIREMENKNAQLESDLADALNVKKELERKSEFNARTIQILTKDLVREREDRRSMVVEFEGLKQESMSLKRETRLARKMREDLEQTLSRTKETKQIMERKVQDMSTILRDKALEMNELQRQLSSTIASAEMVMPRDTKAVELPPIVVKSGALPTQPSSFTEGRVLAVNDKERFVIVDLGANKGVKPGDQFLVVSNGNNIGTLKVVETRQDIAACDITQAQDRIREGDIVRFSP